MTPAEILKKLHSRKVDIWLSGDDLKISGDESALTDDLVRILRQHKRELVAYLSQRPSVDDLSAEWRQYARWSWTAIKMEAARGGDAERVAFAREVLGTIQKENDHD
ncbi:MAG: hypothetical protein WCP87_07320 [Atribacterota bacterium]